MTQRRKSFTKMNLFQLTTHQMDVFGPSQVSFPSYSGELAERQLWDSLHHLTLKTREDEKDEHATCRAGLNSHVTVWFLLQEATLLRQEI